MVVVIRVVFVLQNLAKMRVCSLVAELKFLELLSWSIRGSCGPYSSLAGRLDDGKCAVQAAAATYRDAGLEMMSDWCSVVALAITVYGPEVDIGLD